MKIDNEIIQKSIPIIQEIILQDFEKLQQQVVNDGNKNEENLIKAVEVLCKNYEKNIEMQNKVAYMDFCFYRSCILTESYEVEISFMDKSTYLKKERPFVLWNTQFIMEYYKKNIDYFEKKLRKQIPKIEKYECKQMRQKLGYQYLAMIQWYIQKKIDKIINLDILQKMDKEENFCVVFGGIYERKVVIWPN